MLCESRRALHQGFVNTFIMVNSLLTLFFITEPIQLALEDKNLPVFAKARLFGER